MIDSRSSAAAGDLFAAVSATPAVQSLRQRVEEGGVLSLEAVCGPAQPFLAALLARLFPGRCILAVTAGLKAQESFHQDVQTWMGGTGGSSRQDGIGYPPTGSSGAVASEFRSGLAKRALQSSAGPVARQDSQVACATRPLFFPAWEVMPGDGKLPHVDVISDRLETLTALDSRSGDCACASIIVASVPALVQKTFGPDDLRARTKTWRRGDRIDPLDLVEWLEDQAYEPEAQVSMKGHLSLRGGILDVWPLTSPWPVRMEFFGDELDSLRYFEPVSQMSREEEVRAVVLPPAGELGLLRGNALARASRPERDENSGKSEDEGHEGFSAGAPKTAREARALPETLFGHLPEGTILLLCEPQALEEQAERFQAEAPADDPLLSDWGSLLAEAVARKFTILKVSEAGDVNDDLLSLPDGALGELDMSGPPDALRLVPHPHTAALLSSQTREGGLRFQSLEIFRPIGDRPPEAHIAEAQRKEFFAQLHRWTRQGWSVHLFCNNDGERQRFEEIWHEYGLDDPGHSDGTPLQPHLGTLARGFLCETARQVVVTDAEVFGRYKAQRPRRLKSPHAQSSRSLLDINFAELEAGDYVVHLQHGIGRYQGLQTPPPAKGGRDAAEHNAAPAPGEECLVIEFAPRQAEDPPPRLYVPVSQAHLVGKYVGAGKAHPPLSVLGGMRWAKAKEAAEGAVRDLAAEMLRIQAARASQPGHACKVDTSWQREFESSFVYEETPDQWRAIVETKKDLEQPRPMDRLICGDVGYGKTEVAIRAAFKAAMDGRQTAVLVPTTVLAQQHFNTFRERMADYPIRIELLSRFRTRREQGRVARDLAAGSVDIVIGTHRLVQSDIAFKDLGLVIIDEEQRFGVMHKEKFKRLRTMVDVLTLTATPIPRTLYLALAGARDLSTIETPPQDRLPVETIVTQYDERTIRDAIHREMNRNGQVFYLHNRIHDLEAVAQRLRQLVPDARLGVGHGQMPGDELEEVMTEFVNGRIDVLLSTTIIESGLDIPNANTMIIDRADRFGLSDLYQLRGRVGRYNRQAYAYLLIPRHAGLLSDARKRISAIKQYSTLGSGFKIAMRDLEIRGAGNLLGAEQSGHITAVGFELYCQLLKQSVSRLKGENVKPRIETEVRLDFLALSPGDALRKDEPAAAKAKGAQDSIQVPREVLFHYPAEKGESQESARPDVEIAPAWVPMNYVIEPRQRIEIYRKLAQADGVEALAALQRELRDRFGPVPDAVELLLKATGLKILAGQKEVSAIETKGDKLMLTRRHDFIMEGGKFPRLTKRTATARLNEIKRLLLAL